MCHVDAPLLPCLLVRMLRSFVACLGVGLLLFGAASASASDDVEARAHELEERLLAPCCWTQTLDVHESPLVTEMRLEIRSRLAAGETPLAIEDSFAQRHGERVRAMPRGRTPMLTYVGWFAAALTAVLVILVLVARRWTKRTATDVRTPSEATDDPALDAQIDQAMAKLD